MPRQGMVCRNCRSTGWGLQHGVCPACGLAGQGHEAYEALRKANLLTVSDDHRRRKRHVAVAAYICLLGAMLALVGLSGGEDTLMVIGVTMIVLAVMLAIGSDAMQWLVAFTRSRAGRISVWICLIAISVLVAFSMVPVA